MKQSWLRWSILAAAALPALLPLVVILKYGVDVPIGDQWSPDFAGLYITLHQGQLTLFDFTAQHNEHRIVISRIIPFLLNLITKWNTVGEMLLGWLVVCLTSLGLLRLIVQTAGAGRITRGVAGLWFVVNVLLFSATQWENWLWGIGIVNFMPMLWIVGGWVVMQSAMRDTSKYILTGLCATAAMFSSGSGIFAWPLIGVLLIWGKSSEQLSQDKTKLIAWASGFAVCLLMYFANYRSPAQTDTGSHDAGILVMIEYFILCLGNTMFLNRGDDPIGPTFLAGLLVLFLFSGAVAYFIRLRITKPNAESSPKILLWLLCGVYSLLCAMMAAIFRTRLGIQTAFASRYISSTIYLPIALVMLAAIFAQEAGDTPNGRNRRAWLGLSILLVIVTQLWMLPTGLYTSWLMYLRSRQTKGIVLLMNVLPDDDLIRLLVDRNAPLARFEARTLDEMGYIRPALIRTNNAASIQSPSTIVQPAGHVDQLQRTEQNQIVIEGWAISPRARLPADAVVLTYDDEHGQAIIFAAGGLGTERPDVVAALGESRYLRSGWIAIVPESRLPAQDAIRIRAWSLDVDTGHVLELGPDAVLQRTPATRPL